MMGKGYKHGAGGGASSLNFDVIGYATEELLLAATPKENTIGIITGHKITGYAFGPHQPENLADGNIWIATGNASQVGFNALRKNRIQLFPLSAKQIVSGSLVDVAAKIYQNGDWMDWWNGELYSAGNEFISITGGWVGTPKGYSADATDQGTPTITRGSKSLTMQMPDGSGAMIHTAKKINLTQYSTLIFDGVVTGATGYASLCNFRVWTDIGQYSTSNAVASQSIQSDIDGEVTLDISGLSGDYYVGFALWTNMPVVSMRSMRMV